MTKRVEELHKKLDELISEAESELKDLKSENKRLRAIIREMDFAISLKDVVGVVRDIKNIQTYESHKITHKMTINSKLDYILDNYSVVL